MIDEGPEWCDRWQLLFGEAAACSGMNTLFELQASVIPTPGW